MPPWLQSETTLHDQAPSAITPPIMKNPELTPMARPTPHPPRAPPPRGPPPVPINSMLRNNPNIYPNNPTVEGDYHREQNPAFLMDGHYREENHASYQESRSLYGGYQHHGGPMDGSQNNYQHPGFQPQIHFNQPRGLPPPQGFPRPPYHMGINSMPPSGMIQEQFHPFPQNPNQIHVARPQAPPPGPMHMRGVVNHIPNAGPQNIGMMHAPRGNGFNQSGAVAPIIGNLDTFTSVSILTSIDVSLHLGDPNNDVSCWSEHCTHDGR